MPQTKKQKLRRKLKNKQRRQGQSVTVTVYGHRGATGRHVPEKTARRGTTKSSSWPYSY